MKKLQKIIVFTVLLIIISACGGNSDNAATATNDKDAQQTDTNPQNDSDILSEQDANLNDSETVQSDNNQQNDSEALPEQDIIDNSNDSDVVQNSPCTDYATEFPLKAGDCVPDFTLPAHDGTAVKLSSFRGKFVLLSSFPMVNTPVCTGQMQKLDAMYDQFIEANAQPFGFNNESPDKKDEWCETMGVKKLLILSDHDPKDAVSKMFGINGSTTKRANTFIGPDGRFLKMEQIAGSAGIEPALEYIKSLEK